MAWLVRTEVCTSWSVLKRNRLNSSLNSRDGDRRAHEFRALDSGGQPPDRLEGQLRLRPGDLCGSQDQS